MNGGTAAGTRRSKRARAGDGGGDDGPRDHHHGHDEPHDAAHTEGGLESGRIDDEEELLRARREKDERRAKKAADRQKKLEEKKYKLLQTLLSKTELYSSFLTEQLYGSDEVAKAKAEMAAGDMGAKSETVKIEQDLKTKSIAEVQRELTPLLEGGTLKDYQLKGIAWLISLWSNGLSGILADEMGLGKTVQTIGLLSHLVHKGIHGPFLVVGPLSTLANWVFEVEHWCPSLKALLYHGTKEERQALRHNELRNPGTPDFPVVVSSYEIIIADRKFLQRYDWKYIIVDEGHRLKNFNCRLIRELRQLPVGNKLLLTGTPLQNNLSELWSLLNFLLPDVFDKLEQFQDWFDFSDMVDEDGEKKDEGTVDDQRADVIGKLHKILQPFLLRRLKGDVDYEVPSKSEIIIYAQMTDKQKDMTQKLLSREMQAELKELARQAGVSGAGSTSLNNIIMQMRKVCNHPDLITGALTDHIQLPTLESLLESSGKMQMLDRLLKKLLPKGHKVLIFSQMVTMLDIIENYLVMTGVKLCRLDGSTAWQERRDAMKVFNEDPSYKVFLLSTRAGGLGINLTGADTVIFYDSDWNPHQDMQAMDRCHRIGQTKPVLVLRLVTAGSVDGKMLKRAESKMQLEQLVLKKGTFKDIDKGTASKTSGGFSFEELESLLESGASMSDRAQSRCISDENLDLVLQRDYLLVNGKPPAGEVGEGWETVRQTNTKGGGLGTVREGGK